MHAVPAQEDGGDGGWGDEGEDGRRGVVPQAVVSRLMLVFRCIILLLPLSIHVASIKYFVAVLAPCVCEDEIAEWGERAAVSLVQGVVVLCCVFLADRIRKSLGHFVTRSWESRRRRKWRRGEAQSDCQKYCAVQTFMPYLFSGQMQPFFSDAGAGDYSDNTYPVTIESAKSSCRDDSFSPESQVLTPIHPITETSQM